MRIRADGIILCAAMHGAQEGDCYVDDGLHYYLSVEKRILVTELHEKHKEHGRWWWKGQQPVDVAIDPFYLECK